MFAVQSAVLHPPHVCCGRFLETVEYRIPNCCSRFVRNHPASQDIYGPLTITKLDPRTSIPIYTIGVTTVISILLSLIILGSSVAFNNIVSLSVVGLYSSYLLSCSLLLWRRINGSIKPPDSTALRLGPSELHWGP